MTVWLGYVTVSVLLCVCALVPSIVGVGIRPLLSSLSPGSYHVTSLRISHADSTFTVSTPFHVLSTSETHPHYLIVHVTTTLSSQPQPESLSQSESLYGSGSGSESGSGSNTATATATSLRIHLTRNIHLVTDLYRHVHWHDDNNITITPSSPTTCYYHGRVATHDGHEIEGSHAAIDTCQGYVTGTFSTGPTHPLQLHLSLDGAHQHYHDMGRLHELDMWKYQHAHTASAAGVTPISSIPHIIYHTTSYQPGDYHCGVGAHGMGMGVEAHDVNMHIHAAHRDALHGIRFHTATTAPDCSTAVNKYVEMFLVNDNNRYTTYGSNVEAKSLAIANAIQSYYAMSPWACKISPRLTGQITFASGNPAAINFYPCNQPDPRFLNGIATSSPLYQPCCVDYASGDILACPNATWCAQDSTTGCQFISSGPTSYTRSGKTFYTQITATISSTTAGEISSSALLSSFNAFMSSQRARIQSVFPSSYMDNAVFLTDTDFDGATVGLAPVGAMCSTTSSGSVVQSSFVDTNYVGSIAAHEMGHNFGMQHDTTTDCVSTDPTKHYIMIAASSPSQSILGWSTCSMTSLNTFFQTSYQDASRPACLENDPSTYAPATSIVQQQCGNGVVENGEVCDPGLATDACCTSSCKLAPNCSCANTDRCCSNGKFIPASQNQVCRASVDPICDPQETCDGTSGKCPVDVHAADALVCSAGFSGPVPYACYRGQCMKSFAGICAARTPALSVCTQDHGDQCGAYAQDPNTGKQTGSVWCATSSTMCSSNTQPPPDGTPCSMDSNGAVKQCFCGVCGGNPTSCRYAWSTGPWSACTGTPPSQTQTRVVTCMDTTTYAVVANTLCSSASQPSASQACGPGAPTSAPTTATATSSPGSNVLDTAVDIGGTQIKMSIIIPVAIGAFVLCIILIVCIYRNCRSNPNGGNAGYGSRKHGYGFGHEDQPTLNSVGNNPAATPAPSSFLPSTLTISQTRVQPSAAPAYQSAPAPARYQPSLQPPPVQHDDAYDG